MAVLRRRPSGTARAAVVFGTGAKRAGSAPDARGGRLPVSAFLARAGRRDERSLRQYGMAPVGAVQRTGDTRAGESGGSEER